MFLVSLCLFGAAGYASAYFTIGVSQVRASGSNQRLCGWTYYSSEPGNLWAVTFKLGNGYPWCNQGAYGHILQHGVEVRAETWRDNGNGTWSRCSAASSTSNDWDGWVERSPGSPSNCTPTHFFTGHGGFIASTYHSVLHLPWVCEVHPV